MEMGCQAMVETVQLLFPGDDTIEILYEHLDDMNLFYIIEVHPLLQNAPHALLFQPGHTVGIAER